MIWTERTLDDRTLQTRVTGRSARKNAYRERSTKKRASESGKWVPCIGVSRELRQARIPGITRRVGAWRGGRKKTCEENRNEIVIESFERV